MRDAMQAVHDRTIELMNSGADVYTAMREVRVPEHLDIGEGYGKTSWNVRAIWEMYAGWFQHRSTTELYGVAPNSVAAEWSMPPEPMPLSRRPAPCGRRAPGGSDCISPTLSAPPSPPIPAARAVAADAHEALLADTENFWEKAWLTKSINELRTTE